MSALLEKAKPSKSARPDTDKTKRAALREAGIGKTQAAEAEELAGELMDLQAKAVGKAKGGQPHQRRSTGLPKNPVAPTLAEAGIDKDLAKRASLEVRSLRRRL